MAGNIDPVIIELKVEFDEYQKGMVAARRAADRDFGAIEARSVKMGKNISAGFVASIGIDTITRAISEGLNYAASLGEVATQLGTSTQSLQEYRYAASQTGLATEEIDLALKELTRRIGEGASGTKAQVEAFEKLGISLRDAKGNIISTGDAIPLIAEGLKQISSEAEKATLRQDLFGRSGYKMGALLANGAAGVNGLRDAAHRLGIVLSEQQIQNADKAADKLEDVKKVLSAKIAGVVADNAGAIVELADALARLAANAIGAADKMLKFYNAARAPNTFLSTITGIGANNKPLRSAGGLR